MVFNLTISEEDWMVKKLNGDNVIQNKSTFIHYLMNWVKFVTNPRELGSVSIRLPTILTKEERHIIHKFTSLGFSSESFDFDDDRYMVVYLGNSIIREYIEINGTPVQPVNDIQEEIVEIDQVEIEQVEINHVIVDVEQTVDHVTVDINEEVVLRNDKEDLFNIMMEFIEKNLSNQLSTYITKNYKITKN